jgi:hypothetical protein
MEKQNNQRQVVGKCLGSPETFAEIPQKLDGSNKTMTVSIVMK